MKFLLMTLSDYQLYYLIRDEMVYYDVPKENDAKLNKIYTISGMCDYIETKTKTRLLELGFFKGEKIKVLKKSLLGGVVLVEIMNTVLSIRKEEALCVQIK